jgi:hypothetical protein
MTMRGSARNKARSGRSPATDGPDGWDIAQERDAASTVTANLMSDPGLDDLIARTDSAGVRSYLADALCSTVVLADINGVIQTRYSYQAYGKTTTSGALSRNAYQYTERVNRPDFPRHSRASRNTAVRSLPATVHC